MKSKDGKKTAGSFKAMALTDEVLKGIDKLGFRFPTPIQRRAIPTILNGSDVVAMARTGSGKTASFVIPLANRLQKHSEVVGTRGLILAPSRELAMQQISRFTDLRAALIVGGHSMEGQFERLTNNPDVIVATPGRLVHHMDQGCLSLTRVEMLIFDEADRLFELGFAEQLQSIMMGCPPTRQALLFSATLPSQLVRFSRAGLHSPEFVRLDAECVLSENLDVSLIYSRTDAKPAALLSTLRVLCAPPAAASKKKKRAEEDEKTRAPRTIVFVATRHHVDFLGALIERANIAKVSCVYGSMEQETRTNSLTRFRTGQAQVLVVTDVAARGIDIPNVENIIHFDFPCSPKLFVHRSGRTARAGQSGTCIALVSQGDLPYVMDVLLFVGFRLNVAGQTIDVGEEPAAPAASAEVTEEDGLRIEVDEGGGAGKTAEGKIIEIGSIPHIDDEIETVSRMIAQEQDLASGFQSMTLSYGPYYKTRPSASKQSVKKAKSLVASAGGVLDLSDTVSSIFTKQAASGKGSKGPSRSLSVAMDTERRSFIHSLRAFRPSQLTHNHSTGTKGEGVVNTATRLALEKRLYASKRARDAATCEMSAIAELGELERDVTEQAEEETPQPTKKIKAPRDYRCHDFYHSTGASNSATDRARDKGYDLEQNRMDLVPDTGEGMLKAKQVMKWDKHKKKYLLTKIGIDGKVVAPKRNESGVKVAKATKEKDKYDREHVYEKWMKTTKRRVQRVGEMEETGNRWAGPAYAAPKQQASSHRAAPAPPPASVESKAYHGSVPWNFLTNKQKRLESRKAKTAVTSRGDETRADTLKTVSSIAKERKRLETRKILQDPKRRKAFAQESKEAYQLKQASKAGRLAAPARSRALPTKPMNKRRR